MKNDNELKQDHIKRQGLMKKNEIKTQTLY